MKCWGPASLSSKSGGIRPRCASSLDTEECLGAFAMQKLATILSTVWTYSEDWRDHMAVLMGWASVWAWLGVWCNGTASTYKLAITRNESVHHLLPIPLSIE